MGRRDTILLPLLHLSSNCIISNLFYCSTIEQFLIQKWEKFGENGQKMKNIDFSFIVPHLSPINDNLSLHFFQILALSEAQHTISRNVMLYAKRNLLCHKARYTYSAIRASSQVKSLIFL